MEDKLKVMTDLTGRMSTEDLDDSQSNNPMADEPHKPKRPFKAESKNWMAQTGYAEVDDMEVVRALGLDPSVAYSNAINRVAIVAAEKQAYDGYLASGYNTNQAKKLSQADTREAINIIKEAEKATGKSLF